MPDKQEHNDDESPGLLGVLLPYLLSTCLLSVALTFGITKYAPATGLGTIVYTEAPAIVTFDVVKYMNAQRSVASAFLNPTHDKQAINELLQGLSERTRKAISAEAGPGTIVLLKQTVVQGQFRDITTEVLDRLSLPVSEVPTSNGIEFVLDHAPTMMYSVPTMQKYAKPPAPLHTSNEEVLP